MKKFIVLLATVVAIGLFSGCIGDSSSSGVVKTDGSSEMNSTSFDETTGAVTKATEIKVGNTNTSMNISEGTVLQDEDGNPITKAPTLKVNNEKDSKEAKTTLDFNVDGKKVIPTEPVVVSVPAPAGAKAGDRVQIEVPDDGSITNKLIFVIVKADGTIDIRLFPKAFRKKIVIVVVIIKDKSTN